MILLQLYWHLRRPDCELLKETLLLSMKLVKLKDLTEEQAIKDGFSNLGMALLWFKLTYSETWYNAKFWIIGW